MSPKKEKFKILTSKKILSALRFSLETERHIRINGMLMKKMKFRMLFRSDCHLRWLDWIFLRGYLPSLSINYVATSKDMAKKLPQVYYIKMKISYDLGFNAIGVAIAT